jgi:uncharacterized protein YcfJ
MRNSLLVVCLLAISCVSNAQSGQSSWANLSGLRAGQKIQIDEMNSKKHSGIFESVSDSAISIRDVSGEMSAQKQDVRSVKLLSSNHRLRNTLIGAGVGAGAGAITGAVLGETQNKGFDIVTTGELTAAGALGSGVIGAVVGVLLPSHDTIYRVSSH